MSDPKRGQAGPFHQLKIAPIMPSAAHGPAAAGLPRASPPSLDGIEIVVPVDEGVDETDIVLRFNELRREVSPRTKLKRGEAVKMGDTVRLDLYACLGGVPLPGFYRDDLETELAHFPYYPGVAELLDGEPVGDQFQLTVKLGDDYPLPKLRGSVVEFIVALRAAHRVSLLGEDSPALLEKLGRGRTTDEVVKSIHRELLDEAAALARMRGQNLVLDELVRRAEVRVSDEQVTAEIAAHWNRLEGDRLRAREFAPDVLDAMLHGWTLRTDVRAEAERRLKIAGVLQAIMDRDGLTLKMEPEELLVLVHTYAMPNSTVEEVRAAMLESPGALTRLIGVSSHLRAVEHVMKHAKVTYRATATQAEREPAAPPPAKAPPGRRHRR